MSIRSFIFVNIIILQYSQLSNSMNSPIYLGAENLLSACAKALQSPFSSYLSQYHQGYVCFQQSKNNISLSTEITPILSFQRNLINAGLFLNCQILQINLTTRYFLIINFIKPKQKPLQLVEVVCIL